jgi:hypothetical protein
MDLQAAERFFADAIRQEDRWPAALDPTFAQPDDRSLFHLLDFACRFSSLVRYYSLDNRADGDWTEFFTRDPIVTMASLVATDVRSAERRLARLEERARGASSPRAKPATFKALLEGALALPRQIDRWLVGLSSPFARDTSVPLRATLESDVRRSLRGPLKQLLDGNPCGIEYAEFTGAWRLEEQEPVESIYAGASVLERIDAALPRIRPLWQPFPDAVAGWAAMARPHLSKGFEGEGAHDPHIALFVAFARLYSTAQASINGVAARRTDFYFRRVLREAPRPAVPDTAHLAVTCAAEGAPGPITVPAGTLFSAGKDAAGRPIVFASQDEVRITSAALRKALTVSVVSGRLADGIDQIAAERVLAREIIPEDAGSDGWSTFGSVTDAPANIGFTIGSPVLELAGGERHVSVTLRCEGGGDAVSALSARTGLTPPLVLASVLERALALDVSTTAGWYRVERYSVEPSPERGESMLGLRFTLSPQAPAVTGIPGSGVAWPHPAVRAFLRQERISIAGPGGTVSIYPLSVLEGINVTHATVDVDVNGLRASQLSNVNGEVDQSRPFPVLGAIPTVGSALRIQHPELFSKTVKRLAVHIKWYDLPKNDTGFHGYFRGYVVDQDGNARPGLFDNQVFRIAVTVDRPGSWEIHDDDETRRYMFRTVGPRDQVPGRDQPLAARTSLDDLVVRPRPAPSSDYAPADGCVRVELTAPDYAFGHTLYQQNAMRAAMASAPSDAACESSCRDQFKVLAETRRHLEALLKDLRRRRPAAAARRAASPRFWAGLPVRGLNAAYLALTRSLPAYARRPRDAAPRSASAISVHYGDADVREPAALPLLDRQPSRQMVAARFDMALRALLNEAAACLSACVSERTDRLSPQERQRLHQRLTDAAALNEADRLRALRDLRAHLEQPGVPGGGDASRDLLVRSDTMLEAAAWVADCRSGSVYVAGWSYWRSVQANLVRCNGALQRLYDSAIPRCKENCLRMKVRPMPNPPYVPHAEALTVDYSASASAALAHLLPLEGYSVASADPQPLLPRFAGIGSLYLGFSPAGAMPTLRLYVQLGQPAPDAPAAPPISWDALVENRWTALEIAPGSDATVGLQRSGIISLPLPPGEAGVTSVLPGELRWFRAAVHRDVDAFPRTSVILPHALKAVRQIPESDAGDPGCAVAAGSIGALVKPIKGVGPVLQPSASFGGRSPESERALYTRISERLRHKDRAIQIWDYERLVLERFPDIAMVRVVPARRPRPNDPKSAGPGHVRVVVVPGRTYPGVTDVTAPTATSETLAAIARMLKAAAGPFVTLHVLNPTYLRLKVDAVVQWRDGVEAASGAGRLNASLIEYLSPWRSDAHGGVRRTVAEVEGFVRSCPEIELVHATWFSFATDGAAEAEPERCMLTSALRHDIRTVAETAVSAAVGY